MTEFLLAYAIVAVMWTVIDFIVVSMHLTYGAAIRSASKSALGFTAGGVALLIAAILLAPGALS